MKLPKGWLAYKKSARIKDTPFVACKTPLREGYSTVLSPEDSFTPRHLLMTYPEIKLVIDLTCTKKYYHGQREFQTKGVNFVKIACRGHGFLPQESHFNEFANVVEKFLRSNPKNHLIAVHCTHGVNRTGYMIVRFMVEKMGYVNEEAIQAFSQSRGHPIERANLIDDLLTRRQPRSQNLTLF